MKKLISLILAICLLLGAVPVSLSEEVLPEENAVSEPTSETVELTQDQPDAETAEENATYAEAQDEIVSEVDEEEAEESEPAEDSIQEEEPILISADQDEENQNSEDSRLEPVAVPAVAEEQPAQEEAETVLKKDEVVKPEQDKTDESALADDLSSIFIDGADIEDNGQVPDKMKTFRFANPKPTEVTLEWDPVTRPIEAPVRYEVRWATTNDFDAAVHTAVLTDPDETSYSVSNLTCGVLYYYWIRACYITDEGNPTDWARPLMKSYATAPAKPTGFDFALAEDSAVRVDFWWDREEEASGYIIYNVVEGKEIEFATKKKNPTTEPVTLTAGNITPADELVFRIYSYKNVNGKQVKSAEYDEVRKEYSIPAPRMLKAESLGKDSIQLSWTSMEGATKYVVDQYDGSTYKTVYSKTATTCTVTGLVFGKDYSFSVTAWIEDKEGETSSGMIGRAEGVAPTITKAVNAEEDSSNTISWSAADSADGYDLEWTDDYDSDEPTWHLINLNALKYTHSGLELGKEYTYHVHAYVLISGNKVATPWSKVVSVTAKPPKPKKTALTNVTYNSQSFEWEIKGELSDTEIQYEVQYSTSSSFTASTTQTVKDIQNTEYLHENCVNGTKYYYRVRAVVKRDNKIVYGPYSDTASLKCAPAKQEEVEAYYEPGINQVTVKWALTEGATDYQISYKENDGDWTIAATRKSTLEETQSYTVKNLNIGSIYSFAVSAVRTSDGKTAVGEKTEAQDNPIELEVAAYVPTDVTYKVESRKKITLSWKSVKGISTYVVTGECEEDPDFKDTFGEKEVSTNTITIKELKPGYKYAFYVQSKAVVDGKAERSDFSDPCEARPTPLAPASLTAKTDTKGYGVVLSWSSSTGATGYIIETAKSKDAQDEEWSTLMTIADADELTYTVTGLDGDSFTADNAGEVYYYRVRSYIDHGGSWPGEPTAAVKAQIKVPTPVGKTTAIDMREIEVDVSNKDIIETGTGETKYNIYRSKNPSSGFVLWRGKETLPYTDTVEFGTVYYYTIRAVVTNKNGAEQTSPASTVFSGKGKLKPVQGVDIYDEQGGSIEIIWDAMENATGYDVFYRKADVGGSWTLAGSTGKKVYRKKVTGLDPKTRYEFRVAGTAKASNGNVIRGNYSEPIVGETHIREVKNLAAAPKSSTSVTLTWDKTKNATSYQVEAEPKAGGKKKTVTVTTISATLTGLEKNRQYVFRVKAIIKRNGIEDVGAFCEDVEGYTAPAKVTGLTANFVYRKKAELTWKKSADADGYIIQWREPKGDWNDKESSFFGTIFVVTDLTPGHTYQFRIIPFAYDGEEKLEGKPSAAYTLTTNN